MMMMLSTLSLSLALVASAPAQTVPGGDTAASSAAAAAAAGASVTAEPTSGPTITTSGLPRRPAPPRTMEAHWPVFALFVASWIGIALYLLVTGRRSARLAGLLQEREVRS